MIINNDVIIIIILIAITTANISTDIGLKGTRIPSQIKMIFLFASKAVAEDAII